MFENKRVLVTGGAGFIGTNLVRRLVEGGGRVRATLHKNDPQWDHPHVEYMACDLESPDDCRRVCRDVDYVFMCAANSSGAAVMEKTPLVHLTPNLIMNVRMLEAAHASGVEKFLFISSNTVYPVTDTPVAEDQVTHEFFEKYFVVGWMKAFSEIVCDMYASRIKNPMETLVVRPGNLYGEYDKFDPEKSKVIPALIRRAVEGQDPFTVWGDGMDVKDFLYIGDFVEGLLAAMEKLPSLTPLNIASGQPVTIREVLDLILRLCDHGNAHVQFDTSKPTMIPKRLINVSKARDLLEFKPVTPLETGLLKTINWYKKGL